MFFNMKSSFVNLITFKFSQVKTLIICVLCLIFLYSCSKEKINKPTDLGHSYFPYKPGYKIYYDVDSTIWDDFTGQMYFSQSQILDIYESYFNDGSGNQTIRIERFQRKNDDEEWKINKVYTANLNITRAEITEDNLRQVKLVFPLLNNKSWDANSYNSLDKEVWRITELNKAFQINNLNFDSTLIVSQSDESNLISEDIRYEIFANNVGLIKKYEKSVSKNIATQEIIKGKLIIKTIRSYEF